MDLFILIISFIIFIFMGVPICFALGASSLLYFFQNPDFISMLPQRIWAGANSPVMVALPLFILAGDLMNHGGITKRIIDFSMHVVRPFKGGLGEVNVVASMIFGGISGSSVSDTSALGSILIPAMEDAGYDTEFSTGITVASSTVGMIIPPSIPMIMYAMISGASIASLFLAGLIPGILIGLSQIVAVFIISRRRGYPVSAEKFSTLKMLRSARDGGLAIVMPLMIVFAVAFGVATATESAGVAVLYALIIGFFVYRELDLKEIPALLKRTLLSSSAVMIVIAYSLIFTWILAIEQVPGLLGGYLEGLHLDKIWVLIILDLLILFVGTFIDVSPALLLLCPIMIPILKTYGISEIQFGAIMIVGLAIGLVTPPVGMCLNAASKISGLTITRIFKGAAPFIICNILVLILVTFVPEVSTWLPGLFSK